jgi:RNA polymerase sigma factor (sigma-70 family)
MQELDDNALLGEYVERGSEEAFATLVARHVNKVYSVALRHTGNPHQAEEITQAVFIILARKSSHLRKHVILEGWLYQTARLTALAFIRSENRRARREQEACMQRTLNENESDVWTQIAPLLETAMSGLNETDRHAVVLRFIYGKSMKEVGAALGRSEGAAALRLHRAMEKLRQSFYKRGVVSTSEIIAGAISAYSIQPAPIGLAKTITAVALGKGAAVSGPTLTLVKGAWKLMAWANAKTAVIVTATLLATGISAFVVQSQFKPTGKTISASAWTDAGYDDPASTVQTVWWAISRNDAKSIFASMSPECQAELEQLVAESNPPVNRERFLLQKWAEKFRPISEFRVLDSHAFGDAEVLLNLSVQSRGKTEKIWFGLKRVEGQWKMDDFDPKSTWNGRTAQPPLKPMYGGVGLKMEVDEQTHELRIKEIIPDSPASKAGLSPGLVIKEINGVSTAKKPIGECVFLTRGLVSRHVWLTLADPRRNKTNTLALERKPAVY